MPALRPARITFNTTGIVERGVRAVSRALDQVTQAMTDEISDRISKPFPPPSTPGQYPHRRSGFLHDTVTVDRKGRKLFVRVPRYGKFLQEGTSKMRARKFYNEVLFVKGGKNVLRPKWVKLINFHSRKAAATAAKKRR